MRHIAIIGGGIAGLSTAYYLQQLSRKQGAELKYTLLEKTNHWGGKIRTERVDDYLIEAGPDSFITNKPGGLELCRELGIADELIGSNREQARVYILHRGALQPLPKGLRLTVPTVWWPLLKSPLLSPRGKLRMALEPFIPPASGEKDESVAAFVARRFGQEAVHRFAGPLMAGIHVADPHRLSIQSTFPQLVEMERTHGSLVRAMRRGLPGGNKNTPLFVSPRRGMYRIVETLLAHLEGELVPDADVRELRRDGHRFQVHLRGGQTPPIAADAVVLALPAYEAANLVQPLHRELAAHLHDFTAVSTAVAVLAFRKSDIPPMEGYGFLVPEQEKRKILGCTWASAKFASRAPEMGALLRVFMGGRHNETLVEEDDFTLVSCARSELAAIMNLEAEPSHVRVFRWPRGNPQYEVGHQERVAKAERLGQALPGLYFVGSPYRGIGIPDCIREGHRMAERLVHG